jgi:ABC-2 type transport system permease protein
VKEVVVQLRRSGQILRKDLQLGPRSPLLVWALALPVLLTLLIRGVFGGLFAAEPRLGIVDLGSSAMVAEAAALEGLEVTVLTDPDELRTRVAANDLDAGLVLPPGFDTAVRDGERPPLPLFVGGESTASNRILLAVTTLDLIRGLDDEPAPVTVEVIELGEAGVAFELRMLPLIVMMTVAIAGGMLPAAGLVEEKEKGTLQAVLVTPTTMPEVLLAKGALGWLLAVVAGTITLAINGVLTTAPTATLLGIALGGVMMAQIGLMLGAWAPDTNTLFAAWKLGAMVLIFPVVVYIWPDLPTWIARIGPTYYFLQPVWAASVEGAGLSEVWGELAIAAGICVVLVPVTAAAGRRLEGRLGAGTATTSATVEA